MAAIAQAGKESGTLFIPALNRTIKLVEWREDDFYDTVVVSAGATLDVLGTPTAGTSLEFFRDLGNKNLQHTNLRTARRIPAGSEFIMSRIGVVPNQAFGNLIAAPEDIMKIAYAATLSFKINDRLITEGPLYKFQSGYGVTGAVARSAGSADPTTGVTLGTVTIGVPSAAAAPNLMVAQPVADDDDFIATIDFRGVSWPVQAWGAASPMPIFTKALGVTLINHGFIKKPQGK